MVFILYPGPVGLKKQLRKGKKNARNVVSKKTLAFLLIGCPVKDLVLWQHNTFGPEYCCRLLYADDPATVQGYPGNSNMDFMFDDLSLSRSQRSPPLVKAVMVVGSAGTEKLNLVFTIYACAGVKKCLQYDFVCSRKIKRNLFPYQKDKFPALIDPAEECRGIFVYIKPKISTDTRRWIAFLNAGERISLEESCFR